MCIKPTEVHSNALGPHSHSHSLTDSPEQLPVLQVPLTVDTLYGCVIFYVLHHIFTVPVLCFDMFRHLNAYHCVVIAYSVQYCTCCTGVWPEAAHNQRTQTCVSALRDAYTGTTSPGHAFLRTYPSREEAQIVSSQAVQQRSHVATAHPLLTKSLCSCGSNCYFLHN